MQTPTTTIEATATPGGKTATKAIKAKPTKGDKVVALLRRSKGATIAELSKATGWQNHSVRGFLSGTVKKRMGLELLSEKDDKGLRRYRITNAEEI